MNTNKMTAVAAAVLLALSLAGGEALARGGNGGGGRGNGQCNLNRTQVQTQVRTQNQAGSGTQADSSVSRPVDSRRRDGTFLSTGVTANGSTTRPGYGKGLQDGSRLNATPTPPVAGE